MSALAKKPLSFFVFALSLLLGASVAGLVLARPDPGSASPNHVPALPVQTLAVTPQDSFPLQRAFSGRVQARRQSELGFELAGRIAQVFVDEGDVIETGQLLAELDTARLRARRAELIAAHAEAEARLALANATLKRMRGIVEQGGVSRQTLDEASEAQRTATAALMLADQRIATIDVELGKTRLLAPFAATVVARVVDEGRVLDSGHPVLRLQERSTPEIRVGVAGRTIDQLLPGQIYEAEWRGQPIAMRLRSLLPVRAATARTVDALFDPVDTPVGMLAGDIVTLTLESEIAQRGSWLPLSALGEGERGLWSVFVAEPLAEVHGDLAATHRITRQTVDVVHQHADRVFVGETFNTDQHVVISGLQRIVPGQLVRLSHDAPTLAEVSHESL